MRRGPLDYNAKGWERGLPGFDVVLDPIGGSNWRTSYKLLRPGGRTVNYGASTALVGGRRSLPAFARAAVRMPRFNLMRMMFDSRAVMGLMMPTLWDDRGTYGPFLAPLVPLIDDGTITPVIDATFGFDAAPDAHRRLTERRNVGKVVLTVTSGR